MVPVKREQGGWQPVARLESPGRGLRMEMPQKMDRAAIDGADLGLMRRFRSVGIASGELRQRLAGVQGGHERSVELDDRVVERGLDALVEHPLVG